MERKHRDAHRQVGGNEWSHCYVIIFCATYSTFLVGDKENSMNTKEEICFTLQLQTWARFWALCNEQKKQFDANQSAVRHRKKKAERMFGRLSG